MNHHDVNGWAQFREPTFAGKSADFANGSLARAWHFSAEVFDRLRNCLAAAGLPDGCSVVVSGSLNRMEAHGASDLDLLVVIDDHAVGEPSPQEIFEKVWTQIGRENLGLKMPKTNGIFAEPCQLSLLTRSASRGVVDEDVVPFGQRMQLLLDAQPVYNDELFSLIIDKLVSWYSETSVSGIFGEPNCLQWFRHDVLRYWHSLRARAYWAFTDDQARQIEVNLKYRFSRQTIVAAALLSVDRCHGADASNVSSQQETFVNSLKLTPLERVIDSLDIDAAREFLNAYQFLWNAAQDHEIQISADLRRAIDVVRRTTQDLVRLS